MRITMRTTGRPGVTLLEVIFAMAIFLMSVIAIWQLMLLGGERAQDVRFQTRTSLRCQGKLAEVMVTNGMPSSTGSYTAFEDADTDLQWKTEISEDLTGLKTIKVWVKAELPSGKIVESFLSQMMLDPQIRGTTFDQPNLPLTTPTSK